MNQKRYSKEFKGIIALEAIKGRKTLVEISRDCGIHPNQVSRWKHEAEVNFSKIFEKKNQATEEIKEKQSQLDTALKKFEQTTIENEWLKKKLDLFS